MSRDRSVGIALGYGLYGRGKSFSLLYSFQTGSGAQPISYKVGIEGCFPRGKAAGT
jgi:hypothetical protein